MLYLVMLVSDSSTLVAATAATSTTATTAADALRGRQSNSSEGVITMSLGFWI